MAKGFGSNSPKNNRLGYILVLMPQTQGYAASFSFGQKFPGFGDDGEEDFIGITNMLKDAQVWKSKKQARSAIGLYAEFLLDRVREEVEVSVYIKSLQRDRSGELTTEFVEAVPVFATPEGITVTKSR